MTELVDELAGLRDALETLHRLPETTNSYVTIRVTRADEHVDVAVPMGQCTACGTDVVAGPHAFDIQRQRVDGVASTLLYHRSCNPNVDWSAEGEAEAKWAGPMAVVAEALAAADPRVQPLAELRKRRYETEYDAGHLSWRDFAREVREDLDLIDRLGRAE